MKCINAAIFFFFFQTRPVSQIILHNGFLLMDLSYFDIQLAFMMIWIISESTWDFSGHIISWKVNIKRQIGMLIIKNKNSNIIVGIYQIGKWTWNADVPIYFCLAQQSETRASENQWISTVYLYSDVGLACPPEAAQWNENTTSSLPFVCRKTVMCSWEWVLHSNIVRVQVKQ